MTTVKTNFGADIQVNTIKAKDIQILIDSVPSDTRIDAIVIFGSSLNDTCREDSDIDICYISAYDGVDILTTDAIKHVEGMREKGFISSKDILFYSSISELVECTFESKFGVESEILKHGSLVFAKELKFNDQFRNSRMGFKEC